MIFPFSKKKMVADVSAWGVDMHSHLLPGIDDGSPNMETTIQFIKEMAQFGYKKLICTPHILHGVHNNSPSTILPTLQNVREAVKQEGLDIKIDAAAEYMIDEEFQMLLDNKSQLLTFGRNYILIEMSYAAPSQNILQVIFSLQLKGYRPILAHPERYNYYLGDMKKYQDFKDRDTIFQVNLLSLTGYYGKQVKTTAERMIKEGMVEFIGTDMHHNNHLNATKEFLSSKECFDLINKNTFLNKTLLD